MNEDLIFLVMLALLVADNVLTERVLAAGGKEANPVIKWLMEKAGVKVALYGTKAAIFGGIAWAYVAWYRTPWLPVAVCAVYAPVVVWNFIVLRKQARRAVAE